MFASGAGTSRVASAGSEHGRRYRVFVQSRHDHRASGVFVLHTRPGIQSTGGFSRVSMAFFGIPRHPQHVIGNIV